MAIPNGNEDPQSPLRTPIVHITTHNAAGQAKVLSSDTAKLQVYTGFRTCHKTAFTTEGFPPDLNEEVDIKLYNEVLASGKLGIVKPGGTVCRIVDYAPNNRSVMHRTQSIDFGVVLEGTVYMELDDGTRTLMTRGDIAVQRATMHAWTNASDTEWARMMFVLQDCKPLLVGGERFDEDLGISHEFFSKLGNDKDAEALQA